MNIKTTRIALARRALGAPLRAGLALMLSPFLIGTTILVGLPVIFTVALAFTDYDALSPPVWQGFQNFSDIASERVFQVSMRNSFFFVALAVPLRIFGALALALLLHHRRRGSGLYRVSVFLPTVVPDVAYALIWLWIFNPLYGPLNLMLSALGLPGPAWLVNPNTALLALVIMSLFQIGEGFVLLLTALRHIPQEYYDAGSIDGAGRWQLFRFVTLPLLAPWMLLLTVRDIVLTAQNTFTAAYLMTGGGPYYATLFMPLLVYEEAFDRFRFGDAAAMMIVLFFSVAVLLYLVFITIRGWGYEDSA